MRSGTLALAWAILLFFVVSASAHSYAQRTYPDAGARLQVAPEWVVIELSQPPRSVVRFRVKVDGAEVAGQPVTPRRFPKRVAVPIASGPVGTYRVDYEFVAADGHSVDGRFSFRVATWGPAARLASLGRTIARTGRAVLRTVPSAG